MPDRSTHGLGRPELHDIYRALCLTRAAEERLDVLQKQGHVDGGVYRSLGQEAGAVGAAFALRRRTDGTGDFLSATTRAAGALFLFGGEVVDFFRQYLGRGTGPTRGRGANLYWSDYEKGFVGGVSPLGTMVEVMAGITLSFSLREEDRVGMVFYGDGASSTGAWHEGLNVAAALRCPLIVMVENNQWAFLTPTSGNTRVTSFTEKGPGYGIGASAVDGTDVLAVFDTVRRAAALARSGEGAQLVDLQYFRRLGHAQHDPQDYVDPALIDEWKKKDPLDRFRAYLAADAWATNEELVAIEEDAFEQCRHAAQQVLAESLPTGADAASDVYSDLVTPRPWTRADTPDPTLA